MVRLHVPGELEVSGVTTHAAREVPLLAHWRIPVWSAPRQQVARGAPTSVWGSLAFAFA